MGLRHGPDSYGMDESLMERRRVNEEGRKVVKFFFEGRISVAGNGSMMT